MTQQEYIEILSADLGFTRIQRNAHISSICQRRIRYLDELLPFEKSKVIDQLKKWKEDRNPPRIILVRKNKFIYACISAA